MVQCRVVFFCRHSLSNGDLVDPLLFSNSPTFTEMRDMRASANSLNYGAFHPDQYNQENYLLISSSNRGYKPDRPYSAYQPDRSYTAYQPDRPHSAYQPDRPKSVHPILHR